MSTRRSCLSGVQEMEYQTDRSQDFGYLASWIALAASYANCKPEVQYVYDLELPEDTIPKPGDDEVEEFYLWGVEEVQEAMRRGEFKPNCALVVLDFLVRHGILTTENERDYIEIVSRLHRKLEFPTL